MTTTATDTGYHSVMRHEFCDRKGFPPPLAGLPHERLEAEHDWVLLLFARDEQIRRAAGRAAERLESEMDSDGIRDYQRFRARNIARMLSGSSAPVDRRTVGYITMPDALRLLALAD